MGTAKVIYGGSDTSFFIIFLDWMPMITALCRHFTDENALI